MLCIDQGGRPVHPGCGSVAPNHAAKIVYGAPSNNWRRFSQTGSRSTASKVPCSLKASLTTIRFAGPSFTLRAAHHGRSPRYLPAAGMGVRLPDRLKARSRKEPKKERIRSRQGAAFVAALANLPLALGQERAWRASHFSDSVQPGLINTRPGDDRRGY